MQEGEKELADRRVEDTKHKPVGELGPADRISVGEQELMSIELENGRLLLYHLNAQVLEEMKAPDIVVAREEIDFYPIIHQIDKLGCDSNSFLRDDILVFVPEIPYIAQKEEPVAFFAWQFLEPIYKSLFSLPRIAPSQAEVDIRYEIIH